MADFKRISFKDWVGGVKRGWGRMGLAAVKDGPRHKDGWGIWIVRYGRPLSSYHYGFRTRAHAMVVIDRLLELPIGWEGEGVLARLAELGVQVRDTVKPGDGGWA